MKVYITKYALTKGIIEMEVESCECSTNMILAPRQNGQAYYQYYHHGVDWWADRKQAIIQAENMRIKKIASLERQLERLKAMKFE